MNMVEEKQKLYLNKHHVVQGGYLLPVEEKQKLYLNECDKEREERKRQLKRNKSCI